MGGTKFSFCTACMFQLLLLISDVSFRVACLCCWGCLSCFISCFFVLCCPMLACILARVLSKVGGRGVRRVALVLASRLLGVFSWTTALAVATLVDVAGVVHVAFASVPGAPPAQRAGPAVVALVVLVAPPARDHRLAAALFCLLAGVLTGLLAARLRVVLGLPLLRFVRFLGMLLVVLVAQTFLVPQLVLLRPAPPTLTRRVRWLRRRRRQRLWWRWRRLGRTSARCVRRARCYGVRAERCRRTLCWVRARGARKAWHVEARTYASDRTGRALAAG